MVRKPRRKWNNLSKTFRAEYECWYSMIDRCTNEKHLAWDRYGGKGIIVCERWLTSFPNFLADMGAKPDPELTLDRTNNNGNYEPGNCRWVSHKEQNRNRRSNKLLTFRGETLCMAEWAERLGCERHRIKQRLDKGWSVEKALTLPVSRNNPKNRKAVRMLVCNGETKSVKEWSKISGVYYDLVLHRLDSGWPPEKAVFTPPRPKAPSSKTGRSVNE